MAAIAGIIRRMNTAIDPAIAAHRLVQARQGPLIASRVITPADLAGTLATQEATLALLGPAGGWKVGAKAPDADPAGAPLPSRGIVASGASFSGNDARLRGIEVELAVRLGRDLGPGDDVVNAIEAVLPAIELVETRLADWRDAPPLARQADLQLHGALVLGEPAALRPADADLRGLTACLAFDGHVVASTRGANPASDLWRLLAWLARHAHERGRPLKAGQVITTGSCTGMLFAPEGAHVQAELTGLGRVELRV